jgi:hypothetical protein
MAGGESVNKSSCKKLTEALEQALAEQDGLHGVVREETQQANLIYALQEIKPGSHTELALVVWAGTRYEPAHAIVEEYCLRRAGRSTSLFDHPLLSLQGWCMPDTCRILIFREQLEALVKQLTGNRDARSVLRGIYKHPVAEGCLSFATFQQLITPDNGLSDNDVRGFYVYLKERYAEALPYAWCSAIVERAAGIKAATKNRRT